MPHTYADPETQRRLARLVTIINVGDLSPEVGGPSTSHDTSSHAPPVLFDPDPDKAIDQVKKNVEWEMARKAAREKAKCEHIAQPPQESASFTEASSSSAPSRARGCFPLSHGKSKNTKAGEASTSAPRASASTWSLNCFGGSPQLEQSTAAMAEASTSSSGATASRRSLTSFEDPKPSIIQRLKYFSDKHKKKFFNKRKK